MHTSIRCRVCAGHARISLRKQSRIFRQSFVISVRQFIYFAFEFRVNCRSRDNNRAHTLQRNNKVIYFFIFFCSRVSLFFPVFSIRYVKLIELELSEIPSVKVNCVFIFGVHVCGVYWLIPLSTMNDIFRG